MSQNHPIPEFQQPLILKVEGQNLSNPESVRKVIESIDKLKPSVVVVSALNGHTETLQKITELFFDENPEDAWHLFEDFRKHCFEFATKLGLASKVKNFLQEMKKHIQEQSDVDAFSTDEGYKKDFTSFLLSFGEQFALKVVFSYLMKKTPVDVHSGFFQADTRQLIVFGRGKRVDPFILSTSESVNNISQLLKNNPNKTILMAGSIGKENRHLGKDGINTTVALIQAAYQQNGIEPVLVEKEKVSVKEKVFA